MIGKPQEQIFPDKLPLSPGDLLRQKFAANRRKLLEKERSYYLASGHFSSRAAKMLNAALTESIKLSSRPQEVKENTPDLSLNSDDDQEQDSEAFIEQRRQASKTHKVVFFSKPLVSKQYSYEPTPVAHLTYQSSSDEDESHGPKSPAILMNIRRMSNGSPHSNKYNRLHKQMQLRDETIVLAEKRPSNSYKRMHDCDLDDKTKLSGVKKLGLSSDVDDCLFSPPKVAKVSPYFHDEDVDEITVIKTKREKFPAMRVSTDANEPSRSQMVREILPQVCPNEAQDNDCTCEYHDSSDEPANNESDDDKTNSLNDSVPMVDDCANMVEQAEMNYSGYLSWFSDGMRLITNQLNKLIS